MNGSGSSNGSGNGSGSGSGSGSGKVNGKSGGNRHSRHFQLSPPDRIFYTVNYAYLFCCFALILFPLLNLLSQSFSSAASVYAGKVLLFPVGFNFDGYTHIVTNKNILSGFKNSVTIAVAGTVISVALTLTAAYPLSRKSLYGRMVFMWLFTFTMMFNAGLIPNYLLVQKLKMIDSLWALIIPNAVGAWNVIIARTFFQNTIPEELFDAANIDGCSDIGVFMRIVLPLSRPIIAIMVLFYAVGIWNSYFDSLIYLQTQDKFPLQLVLRNIMTSTRVQASMTDSAVTSMDSTTLAKVEVMKYCVIVFSSLPLLLLYPFIQKHFVKGIMIGAVKG
ncbi:MAG: carbohydrate ABC transporter permease [Clostridiales bacterium]|jgi:ABC-type glycerol-3-phosphate transport system permease component|nr:carbohydrate ABC transporter permease [Clostridiales bacterium]